MKELTDQALLDKYFQARASNEEIAELERRMLADSKLREAYLQDAMADADLRSFALREGTEDIAKSHVTLPISEVKPPPSAKVIKMSEIFKFRVAGSVAALLILAGLIYLLQSDNKGLPSSVGTIVSTDLAGWQSEQPTIAGASFRPGTFILQSGMATMAFDSGAEMVLMAPAKFEVVSEMAVTFEYGQASFNVPEGAVGFRIDTRFGHVIDHGTSFTLQLPEGADEALLAVDNGEIAIHHTKGEVKHLTAAQAASMNQRQIDAKTVQMDEGRINTHATQEKVIMLSSRGRENSIVYSNAFKAKLNPDFLLIKRHRGGMQLERRALFAFDVSKVPLDQIIGANLHLNAVPTEWRRISDIPRVSEFTLYGIFDDELEKWPTGHLKWEDAPTIEDATPLARFTMLRAESRKVIKLHTSELLRFIQSDQSGEVGFIVACHTPSNWLVHGIASSRHREAAGPTLELVLK